MIMTQDEWDKIVKGAFPKGERLVYKPRPIVLSPEMYLRGKKAGWITKDDHLDWDKMPGSPFNSSNTV